MKVVRKNGDVLECTPDEYKLILGVNGSGKVIAPVVGEVPKKRVSEVVVKPVKRRRRRGKSLSVEQREFIVNNLNKPLKWLSDELGIPYHRLRQRIYRDLGTSLMELKNRMGVHTNLKKYGLGRKSGQKSVVKRKNPVAGDRLRFVHARAKYYVNKFGWSFEKGFGQGSVDWRNGKRSLDNGGLSGQVSVDKVSFPLIKPLSEEGNARFKLVLINILNEDNKVLRLRNMTGLGIRSDSNFTGWHVSSWNYFVEQFILKSGLVSKYFEMPNKWVATVEDGEKVLWYNGRF